MVELHDDYKLNYDKVWTNLTFTVEKSGHFNVAYNYDVVLNSKYTSFQRQVIWEYEVILFMNMMKARKTI